VRAFDIVLLRRQQPEAPCRDRHVRGPRRDSVSGVTLVEDTLKPGFFLARHHHKKMIEIFYVLDGVVEFAFEEESVTATAGTTLNVPPVVRHEVKSQTGAKLLTIFSPGGFDA